MDRGDINPWRKVAAGNQNTDPAESYRALPGDISPLNAMRVELGEMGLEEALARGHSGDLEHTETYFQGETESDDREFKEMIRDVADKYLDGPPDVVYHPGSGLHLSAAVAFPDARAIFTDIRGEVEHEFVQRNMNAKVPGSEAGIYEFYRADLHQFSLPEGIKADLVISMNTPSFKEDELNNVLRIGGVVIESDTRDGEEWGVDVTSAVADYSGYELLDTITTPGNPLGVFFVYRRAL